MGRVAVVPMRTLPYALETELARVRQVLFVDDDVRVLDGLKRMLRPMRAEWDIECASQPAHALALLQERRFDAIVADMRMPGMDGAELLARAREIRPAAVRIILSGHADRQAAVRSVGLAHHCLAKPCDAVLLMSTVSRACDLRDMLPDTPLAGTVCGLAALPSRPDVYRAMRELATAGDGTLRDVAALVEQDLAMTARVLQLVNSSFFGLGRPVADVAQAVASLGMDAIRALVHSSTAFTGCDDAHAEALERLWRHGRLVGLLAAAIVALEDGDAMMRATARQAGILHDIGRLVLLTGATGGAGGGHGTGACEPAGIEPGAADPRRSGDLGDHEHAAVGASLMGLWGLPAGIVEAIADHHAPRAVRSERFSAVTAVHAGDVLIHEQLGTGRASAGLDWHHLARTGCSARVGLWRAEAERIVRVGASTDGA